MIDYELMMYEVRERQSLALRRAQAARLAVQKADTNDRSWTAAVRSAVGIRVARLGLRLAGASAVRAL